MNILYICGDNPEELGCGTKVRTHFICEALKKLGAVYVFVPPNVRKLGFLANFFRGFTKVGQLPCKSAEDARKTVGFEGVHFDAVVVRYVNLAAEFCAWKIAPCYIDIDDVPLQAFQLNKHRLPRGFRGLATLTVRMWQRYVLSRCCGVWVVKDEDRRFVPRGVRRGILRNVAQGPKNWNPSAKREKLLMSVGLMGYGPNVDGVAWFVREVWSRFHHQHPDWRYAIAGRGTPDWLVSECERIGGIDVLGFVDDLDALYARSAAVVAPIIAGAGSCVKVAESTLHGRKTYVTPFAARGISSGEANSLGLSFFSTAEEFECEFLSWIELRESTRMEQEKLIRMRALAINSTEAFVDVVQDLVGKSKYAV